MSRVGVSGLSSCIFASNARPSMPGILISLTMAAYSYSPICSIAAWAESHVSTLTFSRRRYNAWGSASNSAVSSSTMRICALSISYVPSTVLTFERQLNQKEGALTRKIFDRNGTLVLLDNTIGNRETKTCSCTHLFGGKERIKDALFEPIRYTRARIGNCYMHRVCFDATCDGNNFVGCIDKGISCIGQQINKDLLNLDGVAYHYYIFSREVELNINLPQAQLFPHQRESALNDLGD